MSIKVIVKDDNLDLALEQLRVKKYYLETDHWYKKCQNYHEKPPSKSRKKSELKLLHGHSQILEDDPLALRLKIHIQEHYQTIGDNTVLNMNTD
ncbi:MULTISPECIES: hypothetical protein [unclassified Acinetobacter]|uniref:hypothetical protein n=2 Tax=Moraxellaceae TaxID=468 RepID=UPI0018AB015B|nr:MULTISPECIES: hypothetical protein [unclassified Acinetobacter]MBJ9955074.1 hypothetical protein [Acinetobacter baumannii]